MYRGIATFTLDYGTCPRWLFERMVRLGREMVYVLIDEYGSDEFIRRISDPVWFQALGTVLAFDWNASGLTTILTAALKEAIRNEEYDLGLFICGGKGKTSRKTPEEIREWGTRASFPESSVGNLVYNSRMSAKVDSALVQDGFQIYHHSFFFSKSGAWAVVQQGMNEHLGTARRYHWFSENVNDLVCEPHAGFFSETSPPRVLDLTARKSEKNRALSVDLVHAGYASLMKEIRLLRAYATPVSRMASFERKGEQLTLLELDDAEFLTHPVVTEDFSKSKYLERVLSRLAEEKPRTYEQLVATAGVGPKTVRALALVGEVIYGAPPSYEDPARYSFAHGGKDATPYPVDRAVYDETIEMLGNAARRARISFQERSAILRKLGETVDK
mgnify:CR=1 FL=1